MKETAVAISEEDRDKDRAMMKELVVSLQKCADEQAVEFEKMCLDLLNCIFILQNMEKQVINS